MTTAIGRPRVSDEEIQARVVAVLATNGGKFMSGSQLRRKVRGEAIRVDEARDRLVQLGVIRHGSRPNRYLLADVPQTRELLAGFRVVEKEADHERA